MATKKKRETHLVPMAMDAPPSDVPWCDGFDIEALWNRALERAARRVPRHVPVLVSQPGSDGDIDYDRSDIVDEAMRLAYLAGARDGALESARSVAWLVQHLSSPNYPTKYSPGVLDSFSEMWRLMFDEAKDMGKHCIRVANHMRRTAKKGGA